MYAKPKAIPELIWSDGGDMGGCGGQIGKYTKKIREIKSQYHCHPADGPDASDVLMEDTTAGKDGEVDMADSSSGKKEGTEVNWVTMVLATISGTLLEFLHYQLVVMFGKFDLYTSATLEIASNVAQA
ncbi:hypothetical protein BS17DRAFT_767582 [Gyrodon lividus]|nr:hypothetical protein BS17DRAFT_767582 [Gyrodon lividus]